MKYGVSLIDLTPDSRQVYGRNTGAIVDIVYEGSPAFDANILGGDLIVSVNGSAVKNVDHVFSLIDKAKTANAKTTTFGIIRDKKNTDIVIKHR